MANVEVRMSKACACAPSRISKARTGAGHMAVFMAHFAKAFTGLCRYGDRTGVFSVRTFSRAFDARMALKPGQFRGRELRLHIYVGGATALAVFLAGLFSLGRL